MNLDDIRQQIDSIDQGILDLLSRRADLVHEVGVVKKRDGLQIYAPEREEALLRRLISMNQGRLPEKSIRAIYREIMSAALALEDDLKIAYLGPEGTWTHQAAIKKFGFTVIDLTNVETSDKSRHTKFAASPLFLQQIGGHLDTGITKARNPVGSFVADTAGAILDLPGNLLHQVTQ